MALLNLVLMLVYSPRLGLMAVAIAVVAGITTAGAGVWTVRHRRALQSLAGELLGAVVQMINGVAKIRGAGAEELAFAHWVRRFSQQQTLRRHIQSIEDTMTIMNTILPTFAFGVLFWGAMHSLHHRTGVFLAFYIVFGAFMGGLTSLSNTLIELVDVVTYWERAKPILTASQEVSAIPPHPGQLTGKVAVDHVTFRYHANSPIVLNEITLHAEPGEFIAVVGPSGHGKSTLLRLLL